ncbi:MAG: MoxR family ATPase [Tissierellales bacterium]|jgi:MoxR-like ATPase|nr:MoxR family ATPase [Tissierellales bacterium]
MNNKECIKNMSEDRIKQIREEASWLKDEIKKAIVGQDDLIENVIIAMICGGNVLLEGNPGLGKTYLVKTISQIMNLDFSRIQFTPDLMPSDIIGTNLIRTEKSGAMNFEFHKGPIFGNLILADEINRATPKTQSALLEAMQEKTVTVGKQTYILNQPFFVLATQNPIDMEGTYTLPEAQLDRFLFKLFVDYPTHDELKDIVLRTTTNDRVNLETFDGERFLTEAIELSEKILIADEVMNFAMAVVLGTHPSQNLARVSEFVSFGSSPRGAQALIKVAKVRALLDGRYNVSFDDIVKTAPDVLRHRIILNYEAIHENVNADQLVDEILKEAKENARL